MVTAGTLTQYRRRPDWVTLEALLYTELCHGELGKMFPDMTRTVVALITDYASAFYSVGDELDVRQSNPSGLGMGRWRRAQIVYMRKLPPERTLTGLSERALVNFAGVHHSRDEWIGLLTDSERIAPAGTRSAEDDEKSVVVAPVVPAG